MVEVEKMSKKISNKNFKKFTKGYLNISQVHNYGLAIN